MSDELQEVWSDIAVVCDRCRGRKYIAADYDADAPCPDCTGKNARRTVPRMPIPDVRCGRFKFRIIAMHCDELWMNILLENIAGEPEEVRGGR